eukprot:7185511-Prymnesium_polylepis.1
MGRGHLAELVEQRAAAVARVDGCVGLDEVDFLIGDAHLKPRGKGARGRGEAQAKVEPPTGGLGGAA